MAETNQQHIRLWFLWFQPGVTGINLGTMFFAAYATMAMISFMSFMQPYVLTEIVHVPAAEQGSLIGNLHAFQEVVFICLAGLVGTMSDKLGRPRIYAAGFILVAAGYALYPMADSVLQLYLIRIVFAIG